MPKALRVLLMGDRHSGHRAGLTPPRFQRMQQDGDEHQLVKWATIQRKLYDWYQSEVRKLQPVDFLCEMGDCIDGQGTKSGGTELITSDRAVQCKMAAESMRLVKAKRIVMVRGTGYHAGDQEDWEDQIAKEVHADKIGDHEWLDVNGLVLDLKHHIAGIGSNPAGVATPVLKEALWNSLWAERKEQPRADVIVRGHAHVYVKAETDGWCGVVLPALQMWGSKFGSRRCSRIVNFGFISLDIIDKNHYSFTRHMAKFPELTPKVLKFD